MESREAPIGEFQIFSQDFLKFVRRASEVCFLGFHAVHVSRWNRHVEKQCAARHPVVAVRMIGRNGALVGPEDVYFGPIHLASEFGRRKELIRHARGIASRQRNAELAVARNRLPRVVHEETRRRARDLGWVRINPYSGKDFPRYAFKVFASVCHRAPGVRRLPWDPRSPPRNWEISVCAIQNSREWDSPAPKRLRRRRRGQIAWRRRACS